MTSAGGWNAMVSVVKCNQNAPSPHTPKRINHGLRHHALDQHGVEYVVGREIVVWMNRNRMPSPLQVHGWNKDAVVRFIRPTASVCVEERCLHAPVTLRTLCCDSMPASRRICVSSFSVTPGTPKRARPSCPPLNSRVSGSILHTSLGCRAKNG